MVQKVDPSNVVAKLKWEGVQTNLSFGWTQQQNYMVLSYSGKKMR